MESKKFRRRIGVVILLSIPAIFALAYLVWWDDLGIYSSGYSEPHSAIDNWALAASGFLLLSALAAIVFSFKIKYAWIGAIPSLICLGYFFRIHHGLILVKLQDCDMSICQTVELYPDGTYYYQMYNQNERLSHSGAAKLKGDTLILEPDGKGSQFSSKEVDDIQELKCVSIKPVGFHFYNGGRLCKK